MPVSTPAVETCLCCKRFGLARHSNVPSSSGHWASGLVGEEDVDIAICGFRKRLRWEMRVGTMELVSKAHGLSEIMIGNDFDRL